MDEGVNDASLTKGLLRYSLFMHPVCTTIERMSTTFLSKLQYRNYEQGEFTDSAERTPDEIADMIRSYPWATEGHLAPVGLQGPSITVQNGDAVYIKVSHYYNGKYCLYLLQNGSCSKKIVADIEEAIMAVRTFCSGSLEASEFTTDITFHPVRYFVTKDFRYRAGKGAMFPILVYTIIPTILISTLAAIALMFAHDVILHSWLPALLIMVHCSLSVFLWYTTVMSWRLYFNHYEYSKDQFIEISAGRNEFIFGTEEHQLTFKKDELERITVYRNTQRKNPSSYIELFELTFKDGTQISISSLLLKNAYTKFPGVKMDWVSRYFPKIN